MQLSKLSSIFLAFLLLVACATEKPVIKERIAPPTFDEIDETIFFDFDSDVVSDAEKVKIENLLPDLQKSDTYLLEIHGHADEIGDNAYNVELAKRRSESVKQVFENSGVLLPPIKLFSWGEEIPKIEGEDQQARTKNRRVEIVILP